ncbi:MAG: hypothetical protein RIS85_1951, partial [Pseudomonadota bacterium]|jgi:O-antigen/teichoic acid export membrane protein
VRDSGQPLGPPYLRVMAAYTGVTWPAMAGIAVLAEPLIHLLYGERWLAAAPLLTWIALSQICYVALPLNADLPVLMGRMKPLMRRMILETIISVALIGLTAPFGLQWVAISRVIHGVFWVIIYAPLLKQVLDLRWRDLGMIALRSAIVTVAAVAPLLVSYSLWNGPAQAGLLQASSMIAAGIALWFLALRLICHPLYDEIANLVSGLLASLRRTPAPSAG